MSRPGNNTAAENRGDWLLLPAGRVPNQGRTGRPWTAVKADGQMPLVLWTQAPDEHWVGAPWRCFDNGMSEGRAVRGWLWGESMASDATLASVALGSDPALAGGRFLIIVLHPASNDGDQHFEIVTDRLGSLHAYAASSASGIVVGSSFEAVATYARDLGLDWLGLAGFFAHGFFPQHRTHFQDVEILAPASRHRIEPNSISSQRYWQWHHDVDTSRNYADAVAEFGELFETVVAEMSLGRVAIPISGGLDSRAVVAALPEAAAPWSFSYGYQSDSVETRIAGRLARVRQLPFEAFVVEPYLSNLLPVALATVEGFQDVTQSRQLSAIKPLSRHADALIAAHWGDVWLDDMGWHGNSGRALPEAVLDHTLSRLNKRGGDWLLRHVCAGHLDDDPRRLLRAGVAEGLAQLDGVEDPDFRIKAWKTDHWSFRWTLASIRSYQAVAFPRLPFYDPRLVDFFCTLPTDFVAGRRLEIDYIRQRSPALARVPWQHTGAALGIPPQQAYWRTLPRRAAAKLWRTVRRRPVIERNWQIQFAGTLGRELIQQQLLEPGLAIHQLVEIKEIQNLVDDVRRRPQAANGYALSMLLTFAAWLRRQEIGQGRSRD